MQQVNDYIKNSKHKICAFVEDKSILENLKPYKNISECIFNRNTAQKSDVLMFFDYPADEDILQNIMNSVAPDAIHYMNYRKGMYNIENILKLFSGMIRYTCNTLDGNFNLTRAAAALGITNVAVETMIEIFEDIGMVSIIERQEEFFRIDFKESVEISKTLHTIKYAEFVELINTIDDYKAKFMTMDIL